MFSTAGIYGCAEVLVFFFFFCIMELADIFGGTCIS